MKRDRRTVRKPVSIALALLLAMGLVAALSGVASAATVEHWDVPTAACGAYFMAAGPDGYAWFTESSTDKVGHIDPSGNIEEMPLPAGSTPRGITTGPDGNVYVTLQSSNQVVQISPGGVVLNTFTVPTAAAGALNMITGPDGALWFSECVAHRIGRMTTAGTFQEIALAGGHDPYGLAMGPDGLLWVARYGGTITRIDVDAVAVVDEFPVTPGIFDIACGPDGAMWFTDYDLSRVGRITTTGAITYHNILTAGGRPYIICEGPDGAMWFTEYAGGKIGRITMAGAVTEHDAGGILTGIALGADTGLWACGVSMNRIYRVETDKPVWYLAEGSTAWGYDTYIALENTNAVQVHVQVTYLTSGGTVPGPTVTMPAMSQAVVNPAETLGEADFSTKVTCLEERTIAADRTMTWTGRSSTTSEGHNSAGVCAPATKWYLPEGSSKWGFETWLLVQNPNATDARCTITYMIEGAPPRTVTRTVPHGSRATYNMADDIGEQDASIQVVSDRPVIPERAMYRYDRREGHDSIGTISPADDYYLAEGTSAWGFTTYVLVQNPNPDPADVYIELMTGTTVHHIPPFTMPANSRRTVRVDDYLPAADFSTRVHGTLPIIAERAMYWGDGSASETCHDSIGLAWPHKTFNMADGRAGLDPATGTNYETWTLIQNPSPVPVQIRLSYFSPDGTGNRTLTATIPAETRRTFDMVEEYGPGRAAVTVECITAGRRIMVERAMYWGAAGARTAGTDSIGSFGD